MTATNEKCPVQDNVSITLANAELAQYLVQARAETAKCRLTLANVRTRGRLPPILWITTMVLHG